MPAKIQAKIPAIVSDAPQTASLLSKLNVSQSQNRIPYTSYNYMAIAYSVADRLRANTSILQLLPDLEIAMDIITSCMLDPNGIVDNNIIYTAPSINMSSSVKTDIINIIKKYIDANFKVTDKLPEIIREAMFTKGAYVEAIIPEASVDRLTNFSGQYQVGNDMYLTNEGISNYIKNSEYHKVFNVKKATWSMNVESYKQKYGSKFMVKNNKQDGVKTSVFNPLLLKDKKEIVLSEEDLGFEIIDNYNILRQPMLKMELKANGRSKTLTNDVHQSIRDSFQSLDLDQEARGKGKTLNKDPINYLNVLFRMNDNMKPSDVEFGLKIDETIRESLTSPLIMKLPVESVIPIYAKNEPSKHIGYFVLLDIEGYPINIIKDLEEIDAQAACMDGSTDDLKTGLIQKAKLGLYGNLGEVPTLENIEVLYGDIVDHMIKSKLRNSEFEDLVEIRDTADIYKVMMARALAAKKTKLLYLPLELVQYYAFSYRRNGTGESLLEKAAMLASMAGMLLYSNVKSAISSAVPITDITLTTDEDDPEPLKTAEIYMSNVIKANRVGFPLGLVNPAYLEDWMVRAGFTVNVKSPRLPELQIDRNIRTGTQGDVIDSSGETYDKVMHMIYKLFGISPELIAKSAEDGFASIFLAKDKLFAKRIKTRQAKLSKMLVLSNVKDKDLADFIVDVFRTSIEIDLPSIEFGEEDDKANAFKTYVDTVDSVLTIVFDTAMPATISPKLDEKKEEIKNMVKAGIIHQWMLDNNYMTEAITWYQKTDDNLTEKPYIAEMITNTMGIVRAYVEEYKQNMKLIEAGNKDIEKLMEKMEERGMSTGNSDYISDEGSSEGSEEGTGEDSIDGGEDPFGADEGSEDFGFGESSEDETKEEEEKTEDTKEEAPANEGNDSPDNNE